MAQAMKEGSGTGMWDPFLIRPIDREAWKKWLAEDKKLVSICIAFPRLVWIFLHSLQCCWHHCSVFLGTLSRARLLFLCVLLPSCASMLLVRGLWRCSVTILKEKTR